MERLKDGSSGSGARSADLAPRWLEWGLLAVALALFIWRGFLPAWRRLLTDFPNYYLAGRLFRDGFPLDRLYDGEWLQRQKDHLGLDQPLVGYVPITMFSALLAAPLTSLSALVAKHVWLVFNLLLLPAIGWLLRAITGQPFRRIALIGLLAVVPLRTNFQFGQQHLFVLFLLTVAAWCYFRGHDVSAGAALAVAAAVKLYPAGFVLLLVRKKRWRALASMAVVGLLIAAAGIALFGVEAWNVFAREIVPRAVLRAEVVDPYDTHMSSLTGMLRRLLIFEPELNPHPLVNAPAAFAVLQPLLAAGILATGLWLLTAGRASAERERLDWAATLAFIFLLSTATPTYHLCALILAAVLAVDCLLRVQWVTGARALLIAFTVLCLVTQDLIPEAPAGWRILTAYPRVYPLAVFWLLMVAAQRRLGGAGAFDRRRAARFAIVFAGLVVASSWSGMRHFDGQFAHYARLLPSGAGGWPAVHPAADGAGGLLRAHGPGRLRAGFERPRPCRPFGRRARTCSTRRSRPADPRAGWRWRLQAARASSVSRRPRSSCPLPRCRPRSKMPERRSSPPMAAGSGSSEQNAGGATCGCSSARPARSDPSRAPIGTCSISGSSRIIGWCSPDGAAPRLACSSSGPERRCRRRPRWCRRTGRCATRPFRPTDAGSPTPSAMAETGNSGSGRWIGERAGG